MPIQDFHGNTFVAFIDISGFKEMMEDEQRAVQALSLLNQTGYDWLQRNRQVNGFFVSDCGILFVRENNPQTERKLESLLRVIEGINRRLLDNNIMLKTSIAYGLLSYHQRLEFEGIDKNPIYGNAYVAAYLDNEVGKPKIQPGECRILIESIDNMDLYGENFLANEDSIYQDRLVRKNRHEYFYWMVNDSRDIEDFEKEYRDSYNLKYQGMLSALKRNS